MILKLFLMKTLKENFDFYLKILIIKSQFLNKQYFTSNLTSNENSFVLKFGAINRQSYELTKIFSIHFFEI